MGAPDWYGVLGRAGVVALSPLFALHGVWVACGCLADLRGQRRSGGLRA